MKFKGGKGAASSSVCYLPSTGNGAHGVGSFYFRAHHGLYGAGRLPNVYFFYRHDGIFYGFLTIQLGIATFYLFSVSLNILKTISGYANKQKPDFKYFEKSSSRVMVKLFDGKFGNLPFFHGQPRLSGLFFFNKNFDSRLIFHDSNGLRYLDHSSHSSGKHNDLNEPASLAKQPIPFIQTGNDF